MNVAVTSEHRFDRTPDGRVWTSTTHAHSFWARYLVVFDEVKVISRIRDVLEPEAHSKRADGPNVSFFAIPHYLGPFQYLTRRLDILDKTRQAVTAKEAVVMRVPSQLAGCLAPLLQGSGHPYGLEVIADPWDSFSPRANPHVFRPLFRRWFFHQLRRQCKNAVAAAYVTHQALQRRYPCPRYMISVSDVNLASCPILPTHRNFNPAAVLYDASRLLNGMGRRHTVITVGNMENFCKGHDILIKAVASCIRQGYTIQLKIVGEGRYRPVLERLVISLNLQPYVAFMGALPYGQAVAEQLDEADLFVLASRQEGLPRAMIEAMARGLPCIGSEVGGIPELLSPEDIVPRDNVEVLARKIQEILGNYKRSEKMSERNLEQSRKYSEEQLRDRRRIFYTHVQSATERWLETDSKPPGRLLS